MTKNSSHIFAVIVWMTVLGLMAYKAYNALDRLQDQSNSAICQINGSCDFNVDKLQE